jgi:hypothetical protein
MKVSVSLMKLKGFADHKITHPIQVDHISSGGELRLLW